MAEIGGFWSYVHLDDEADGGRITQLARDVVSQYEMLTADSIHLFLDRDDIEWGDEWKPKIDSTLESVAFFIAILTPRYFQSAECRRELNFFARRATQLGVRELVLPILYVDFQGLHEEPCQDEAMALARSFQWEDWVTLRFAAVDSPEYRRAVSSLAERLASASALAETTETTEATAEAIQEEEDTAPGFMDRLARAEEVLPDWTATMEGISAEIAEIGVLMNDASARVQRGEAHGAGFAARLAVLHEVAKILDEPVTRIVALSNNFTTQLHDVDLGIKAIIEMIPGEMESDPDSISSVEFFVESIRNLTEQAEMGLGEMENMAKAIEPVEQGSRSARPVLRKLRKAVTLLAEGRTVTREWDRLFDQLDLPFGDQGEMQSMGRDLETHEQDDHGRKDVNVLHVSK